MALIRCEFFSDALELSTSMTVILPQATSEQIGMTGVAATEGRHPTLYLLHGLSDDDSIWLRRTSIERYVAPLGLAVVMPQVHRSFYADEAHGSRFWTFLSEELPGIAQSFFPVADRPEDTYVAGLSMGGYGAMKWALRHPERFAAAASLSGALDLGSGMLQAERPEMFHRVFGEGPLAGTPDDLLWLLDHPQGSHVPALFVACGADDPLYDESRVFIDTAARNGVPVVADLGPGDHEWGYWDTKIQDVLAWLPLPAGSDA